MFYSQKTLAKFTNHFIGEVVSLKKEKGRDIMNLKQLFKKENSKKLICVLLLLIVAITSITALTKFATNPNTYSTTIKSIDDKKMTVMGVTASAAITSAGLATIPNTTPIANQILNISSYLLIVVCVLVLEKSLLSVFGYLSFTFLVPIACVLLGIYVFNNKKALRVFATKLLAFALVLVLIIPFSMKISDMVYEMNQTTVDEIAEEEMVNNEDVSFWNKLADKIKRGATKIGDRAKKVLNSFIDAIALFIIAYCVLPIAIVFIVIWLINFLFGLSFPIPKKGLKKLLPSKKSEAELIENKENINV